MRALILAPFAERYLWRPLAGEAGLIDITQATHDGQMWRLTGLGDGVLPPLLSRGVGGRCEARGRCRNRPSEGGRGNLLMAPVCGQGDCV